MIIDGSSTSPLYLSPPSSSSSSSLPLLAATSSCKSTSPFRSQMINACLLIGAVSILLNQSNQYVSSSSSGQPAPAPPTSLASEKNRREARQFLQINKSSQPFATSNGSAPPSGSSVVAAAGPTYEQLELATQSELELAQLLVFKFHDLFENKQQQQQQELNQTICCAGVAIDTTPDGLVPAALETRKIDTNTATGAASPTATATAAATTAARKELNDRSYFKILNRVFSRVELPELYKGSRNPPSRGLHCGPHIGCIEEIPNFPSLLKRPNISSSFTIYTPTSPRSGKRILFEPILHHQLQDGADQQPPSSPSTEELAPAAPAAADKRPANARPHLTAASWRSASRVAASQEYPFDLAALEQSGFDATLNTRIIVGGYFAKEDEEWIDEIVRQWTLLEPMSNIVKVSWPDANRGLYHTAAYNSRIVGRQLTLFLHYLDQLFHIDLGRFHLVGHSLGAHIAGFAGADNDGRIARITGLDPAGPIFVELNTSMRLDPSDAQFVDVMHTNGGSITKGALGLSVPSGHVDYYCNGGSIQPGCYFSSVTKSMMDPVERVACSHRRSYRYFTELIRLAISENALASSPQATGGGGGGVEEEVAQPLAALSSDNITTSSDLYPASIYDTNVLARRLHHADQDELTASQTTTTPKARKLSGKFPRAFLFEAKQEDLVRLSQPEISMMSRNSALRREMAHSDSQQLAPLKRHLEFHEMKPDFPAGKRGLYLFKTRSESPFFASKQYALTLRTDGPVRRKIILMARVEQTLVAEVEADEIPGLYTIAFAPNDPKLFLNLDSNSNHNHNFNSSNASKSWPPAPKIPQVSLMWRFRSFNLLLNQQNELPLVGLELSLLDADGDQAPVLVKYAPPAASHSLPAAVFRGISGASAGSLGSSMAAAAAGSQHMSLVRNQWHRFEGKLLARPAA